MGIGGVCDRLPELYAWQHEALEAWKAADRSGIVEAVTGTGKTVVGIVAIGEALQAGRRAAVIVPTRELQQQWYRTLRLNLPGPVRLGTLGDGSDATLRTHDVVVAIVNSARHGRLAPPTGALLVADECHRYASEHNRTAFADGFDQRLGLTATLERPDHLHRHVVDFLGDTCFEIGYAQAIADEVTAHFTVALLGVPMEREEEYQYDALSKRLGELTGVLVERHHLRPTPFHRFMRKVKEAAEDREHPANHDAQMFLQSLHARRQLMATSPAKIDAAASLAPAIQNADRTLVFTDSIDTAETVCDLLVDAGVTAETLHSEHKRDYRREVLRDFGRGRLQAVVAPRVLDEGIDVPAADLAVIVAGSRTRRQMVQRLGRVLRRKADDRLARLAILFLETTVEDPRRGGHEVFLGEALKVAEEYKIFNRATQDDAIGFLSAYEPDVPARDPRRLGEAPRTAKEPSRDDEFDVDQVLALPSMPPATSAGQPPAAHTDAPRAGARRAPSAPPPVSAATGERLRTAFRQSHAFVTASERRAFEAALARLVAAYGEEAVLTGIRRSPDLALIEQTAEYTVRRKREIEAAAERAEKGSSGPSSRTNVPKKPRRRRPNRSTESSGRPRTPRPSDVQDKPHYTPSGNTRLCPACGGPEARCGC